MNRKTSKPSRRATVRRERSAVSAAEVDRLLSLTHPDPHSVLGAHETSEGVVVRAFRPDAEGVTVRPEGGEPAEMRRLHAAGLFEARLADLREMPGYRLEARYAAGVRSTSRDPYAFLPTLGELDLHLASEGRHERIYEKLGAHARSMRGVEGVSFAVWAPNARGVSVLGDFNGWDGRLHPMRIMGASGIWELFVPDLAAGTLYKYEIRTGDGRVVRKTDPYAAWMEQPPGNAAVVFRRAHEFGDREWMDARAIADPIRRPLSIYEVHLDSWRRVPEEANRPLTYRELAPRLAEYVQEMGFTHVELLPVMEHPFGGSWGYQVLGYFAPTSRYGTPDDFRFLVDYLHRKGIGVILDWVPAHFPKDEVGLGRFDGTALYEHLDARRGEHPDWGTFIFNYGRNEVRNFLLAGALSWLSEFHADGLRLDAVASMLYADYSRPAGEWVPNEKGGRENLEAVEFLKDLNRVAHARHPGALVIAEESTAWPGVSHPTWSGGLGFTYKWNMGWMHDTLSYFRADPVFRRHHHPQLTFGLLYAWSENFILPLSHDEVVHLKGSLWGRMPGGWTQKFANLRALYGYMWAHPGKKLLFMGGEFAQTTEWDHRRSLDWHLASHPEHRGVRDLVRDLNRLYRDEPALWEGDADPGGFSWIDCHDAGANVVSFLRRAPSTGRTLVCVGNFSGTARFGYRVGLPRPGRYREILNTDAREYGGGGMGNLGAVEAQAVPWHGRPFSASMTLPALSVLWFEAPSEGP